jgi:hypothetical protein
MAEGVAGEGLLDYAEIAKMVDVKPVTLRNYVRRGYMPAPDVMLADRPRWEPETIRKWIERRKRGGNESTLSS